MSELSIFFNYYCFKYLPSLTTAQAKNINIALAITLVRKAEELTQY